MPAAAVIPAPIAYIKVVAVKKLVVGFLGERPGPPFACALACRHPSWRRVLASLSGLGSIVYFEKIRVFKAGIRLNTLAWNNKIGLLVLFCWS